MALPSLNGMRAFEAAARLGSIKDAAEELHLTPSAVSRHIRTLEKTLGQDLFERGFRQVTPTMRGSYYARSLSEAFEAIWRATEDVSFYDEPRGSKARRVKLMCEPTFLNLWLADRLPVFRRQHPTVDLEISTSGKRTNVDFAIVDEFVYKAGPALTMMVPLLLTPVCAPSVLEGPIPLRSPADLVHHHLIHECETTRWKQWLEREGIADARPPSGSTLHDCTLIMREAMNGAGIALADTIMAQDLLRQGKLVAPFAARHAYPAGYYLQQRRSIGNKPGTRLFQDWLLAEVAEHKRAMGIE
ncbi:MULTISPECIES: LysR family transcriptional regulator [unclassified Shinella]|jgi:LysR family glycine cleavage system transcriptional activator|uniref:LysR family transcriptional regulator n=1 Tax=unclassified Shinella TaxID=2643062 RepID=UPI0003C55EE1|nr:MULTISPECIES: LysR family transcriptional regulator [unclassified Shinella]EYR77398.1 transcriptional regulator [Shinella sp. DD12]KNY15736.1 LysR family transcriptional regulator [Shinella sp. SUS2]KOC75871.1 LysR family transcriptional regulator [Shinella sp. GWS1]MCO5151120.1 LysR substrate-binding domain-containing protein [Shinella sp.]MDC7265969.1 LysR family transcriptional regulator [Shinella sp. HY16]